MFNLRFGRYRIKIRSETPLNKSLMSVKHAFKSDSKDVYIVRFGVQNKSIYLK